MRVASPGRPHLSYCTNIHAGESLAEVRAAVQTHLPRVKALLGVTEPFGVGLRLSARAADELAAPPQFEAFSAMLADSGLYVFTLNGFPHGAFHGERVKEAVYRPDWREPERLRYSDRLADLLVRFLPEGVSGSVSTVPGAFAARATSPSDATEIAEHLIRHVATLARLRDETGRAVELSLEPEPCCFLETTAQTVRFFEEHLFCGAAVRRLAQISARTEAEAEAAIRRHLGVCLDACHLAVEFEDARASVEAFRAAGIRIGKIQVTTALSIALEGASRHDGPLLDALERFADGVYLHQVVERRGDALHRELDLPDAIARARRGEVAGPAEWRIHFHVPVFAESLHPFGSTQPFLRDLLAIARAEPISDHLEVETYTWDVLPPEFRTEDVDHAIARELSFTLAALGAR